MLQGSLFGLFFSTSSQMGALEKRMHCLEWACDYLAMEGTFVSFTAHVLK